MIGIRRALGELNRVRLNFSSRQICCRDEHRERFDAPREALVRMRASLERILTENIVPFWYPQSIDRVDGGYRLNHDVAGHWRGAAPKSVVAQARTLWFFARLLNSPYRSVGYEGAAAHGFEFLDRYFWDVRFGGFYWRVDATGAPIDCHKHLYGQSFALYALSEYAIATGDERVARRADELFDIVERDARDRSHGGYREFLHRDWSAPEPHEIGYLGKPASVKTLDTHLHLLEALTRYTDLRGGALVRGALNELMWVLGNAVVRKQHGACTDRHEEDWSVPQLKGHRRVIYGHDLENIWFLIEASARLPFPSALQVDLYETLFFNAWRYGYDHARGGFYLGGDLGRFAAERHKIWWVEAEALVCALRLYSLTRRKLYFDVFAKTLEWVTVYQTDWQRGEWYLRTDRVGVGSGDKAHERAGTWKCCYHNGRAMLRSIELIDGLIGAATAPMPGSPMKGNR